MCHPSPSGQNARLFVTSPREDPSPEPKERERGGFPPPPTAADAAGAKAEAGNPSRHFPVGPLTPCQRPAGVARYEGVSPAVVLGRHRKPEAQNMKTSMQIPVSPIYVAGDVSCTEP